MIQKVLQKYLIFLFPVLYNAAKFFLDKGVEPVTCDMWHVTCDMQHVRPVMWLVTHDAWFFKTKVPNNYRHLIVSVLLSAHPVRVRLSRIRNFFYRSNNLWVLNLFWFFGSVLVNQPSVHCGVVSRGRVCGCGWWHWWQVLGEMWHMTCDTWHMNCRWHMTRDIFFTYFFLLSLVLPSANVKRFFHNKHAYFW